MDNHVHLLMSAASPGGVGRTVQALGRRYMRYINDGCRRTGPLWEGRYKACIASDDDCVLQCHRYIDPNPVRARMVANPADYPWSSYRCLALGAPEPILTTHDAVRRISADPTTRQQAYRALVAQAIDPDETGAIRSHVQHQHAYGSDHFRRMIEQQLGRRIGPKKVGRPAKRQAELPNQQEFCL